MKGNLRKIVWWVVFDRSEKGAGDAAKLMDTELIFGGVDVS